MSYNFETREKDSARHKLEEATFFFDQMKRTLEDDKVFSFYLSAFVTAALSIAHNFIQKEFKPIEGFDGWWYANKQKITRSDDFRFFNTMRVATIHTNPIKPNKKVTIGIFESVDKNTSTSTKTVERFFVQYPKKNLDKRCENICIS